MKSKDLINFLSKHPEMEVVLSRDAKGNDYQALDEPSVQYAEKNSPNNHIEIFSETDIKDGLYPAGMDEDADPENFLEPVIVLYPY